jgi:hypothetical protein
VDFLQQLFNYILLANTDIVLKHFLEKWKELYKRNPQAFMMGVIQTIAF